MSNPFLRVDLARRVVLALAFVMAMAVHGVQASNIGRDWRLVSPNPTTEALNAAVWTGSQTVIVGNNGTLLTSSNGTDWTLANITDNCLTAAWSGSKLVVGVEATNTVLISTDGLTYARTTTNYAGTLTRVIWTGSQFIGLGTRSDDAGSLWDLLTSSDGVGWAATEIPSDITGFGLLKSVAWTGTRYVIVGNVSGDNESVLASSTNGVNWTAVTPGETYPYSFENVIWTGTQAVAVGWGGAVLTSPTGAAPWTQQNTGATNDLYDVQWTGSQLVAVGNFGILTSPDGQTWTKSVLSDDGSPFKTVVVTGSPWVAAGSSGAVFTSSDSGAHWARQLPHGSVEWRNDVVWTGSQFVSAGGYFDGAVETSTDGVTWTPQPVPMGTGFLNGIAWTGTRLVTVGGSGTILTSSNGTDWADNSLSSGELLNGVAATAGQMVVVGSISGYGSGGVIFTSTNGTSWNPVTLPAGTAELTGIARAGSQWVAVGAGGLILTSADGATWTSRTSGSTSRLSSAAGNGSMIVVVSEDQILSSSDGLTWHDVSPGAVALNHVIWTGGDFVAVGNGIAATSTDGLSWHVYSTHLNGTLGLFGLAWDGTQVVAVGENGIVAATDAVPTVSMDQPLMAALESDGTVSIKVDLSFASSTAVTVPFTLSGTATPGAGNDYTASPVSPLTFAPGDTSQTISVAIRDDTDLEPDETVIVTLGTPTGAHLGTPSASTLTIEDNDGPPPVSFVSASQTVLESVGTVGVDVKLGWPSASTITVSLNVTGSAVAPDDYAALPATLTFMPGQTVQTLNIPIVDDPLVESTETVIMKMASPVNATLGAQSQFTLSIQDNDLASGPWASRNPSPISDGVNSVAYADTMSRLVVVGNHGSVMTSDNGGSNWIRRFTNSAQDYHSVVWNGSLFVAVGAGTKSLTSTDGTVWTEHAMTAPAGAIMNRVVWINGTFIALGSVPGTTHATPVILTSMDGTTWTARDVGSATGAAQAATWTGSLFVVVGGESVYNATTKVTTVLPMVLTSPDGSAWTNRSATAPAKVVFSDVLWANNQLVALCSQAVAYTSTNAMTWTKSTVGALGAVSREILSGSTIVAVGQAAATSLNGTTWKEKPTGQSPIVLKDVTKTASGFMAVGGSSTIVISADGLVWSKLSAGFDTNLSGLYGAVWSGTQFVAVGGDPARVNPALVYVSASGSTWSQRTTPLKGALASVAWSGTLYTAVGGQGIILTSMDGTTWTPRASGTTLDLHRVAWTGGQFVAVGGNDAGENSNAGTGGTVLLTSPNGVTWTKRTLPTTSPLEGVSTNYKTLVAVGRTGEVLTSPDGIVWTHRVSGITTSDLHEVCWGNGLFVVTTDQDGIITSADGITWARASTVPTYYKALESQGSVRWTGSSFVAVGKDGIVISSNDGNVWSPVVSGTGNTLHGLAWNGSVTVAVGDLGTIISLGTGTPPVPVLRFTSPSANVHEGDAPIIAGLDLSSPATQKISVPFRFTNDLLGAVHDLTGPASPLVFNPGETHKDVVLTIVNDNVQESVKTGSLVLDTPLNGNASLGSPSHFDISLTDDDFAVQFTQQPHSGWLALGATLNPPLIATATGSGTLYFQWQRSGVNIGGAISNQLPIVGAKLTDGAAYKVIVRNNVAPLASNVAEIAVVDTAPRSVVVAKGLTATLTASAQGTGLQYQWFKKGDSSDTAVANSTLGTRISGAGLKSLVIKVTDPAMDAGRYYCHVTSTAQSGSKDTGVYTLSITTGKPEFASVKDPLDDGNIARAYVAYPVPMSPDSQLAASKFSAKGLPAGLSLDPVFGVISGTPTAVADNVLVTITATNATSSTTATTHLTVHPLQTGVAGSFDGTLPRDYTLNTNQGARFILTVLPSGAYTGKVLVGALTYPFSGTMVLSGTDYLSTTSLVRKGYSTLLLLLSVDPTNNLVYPSLISDTTQLSGFAWRNVWSASNPVNVATHFKGYYTFGIDVPDSASADLTVPHGTGYGSCTVTDNGVAFAIGGKLADGSAFTTSTFLGPNGEVLLYQPLYSGRGGLMGNVFIRPGTTANNSDATVDDYDAVNDYHTLDWYKPPQPSTERTYKDGFDLPEMVVEGSRYVAPTGIALVMGISAGPNVTLAFHEQDFVDRSDTPFFPTLEVLATGKIKAFTPNAKSLTLTVAPTTGAFTGGFNLSEPNPANTATTVKRGVTFYGMIVTDATTTSGVGWFLLPGLPNPAASPVLLPTQTPIRSGQVEMKKY